MAEKEFDLIVIGSGPGGYVAAIRAGQLGLKTACVEKDPKFGGTCLHRGCIPTKALLHTADLLDQLADAGSMGIRVGETSLDIDAAMDHKQGIVDKNAKGIEYLFKKNKVEGIHGTGRMVGPHEVEVEGPDGDKTVYRAEHVLIATGSVPREIPIAETDGEAIINSDHVLEMREVPKSMVVLGAGAVGTEFASMYTSFGTEVTLVEMMPRILPIEDEDASKELARVLKKRGITIKTDTKLKQAKKGKKGVEVVLEGAKGEETLTVDKLLVAVGRAPVSRDLGFEELGVEIDDRGYVEVDLETMQTAVPHIYAIGDVVDTPWLAHVASHEGILAADHMAGEPTHPIDYRLVPNCTYCEPEVASVGLTEAKAKEEGYEVAVGKFPFTALAKASIEGKSVGFVKIVRDTKYDEVLGVHIVGPHATDLIAEACLGMQIETTNEEIIHAMHAHPTLGEAVHEAALAAAGRAIHI